MASLWSSLEKDMFNQLETIRVWRAGKKKKMFILSIVVHTFWPMQLLLVKFRMEQGEQHKIGGWWPLEQLKLVDGKALSQVGLEFELHFNKVYQWTAGSFDEKQSFLRCLWKLNQHFLASSVTFVNVSSCAAEGRQSPQQERKDTVEAESQEELSAYQEMTPKEAADVLKLMEEYKPLVNNSVAFAEQLSNDLQMLDEANLRAIISSEKQVTQLMTFIDEALAEVARVEQTLQVWDELLGGVKQQMDQICQENSLHHCIISNKQRLMDEILFLVTHLDLSREHCDVLSQADLSSPSRVEACTAAAEALAACMDIQIQPGYRKLQAVAEQLIMFETLKQNLENAFITHITNIFKLQGNLQGSPPSQPTDKLCAPSHGLHHQELLPYTPLMAWLRNTNPALFWDLPKVYAQDLSRLYDQEIKTFFEHAQTFLLGRRKGSLQESLEKLMGIRQQSHWSLPGSREDQKDTSTKGNVIKQILGQVLRELQTLCTAEQQFIEKFFQLSHNAADLPVLEVRKEITASPEDPPCPEPQSQLEEATTQVLSEVFSCLEPELRGFLDACNKVHPFSCLQVLVTLNDFIFENWGSSSAFHCSFLNTILGNVLLVAKSNFTRCIGTLCKEMEEAKMPSRTRGGILPSVSRFEELVNFSEELCRAARGRRELDRAHLRLARSVFSSINSLSSANLKVSTDMVMMENFHHIHCFLCQKEIPCLEDMKREAKQRYSEHMEKYIIQNLGQPLEKLHHVFEGVKARVAQGVKEEEVSFQLAYSKQELRKVIEKYPGKEVKRALETLYRTMHKCLCPEENLLPVVWHAMEQELLRQYQQFEDLIQCCYAGSGITMDFTREDLLSYFNSITLSNT
ncbi:exocyst complex component 1-like [Indicator indicator]|uniref:exocyst complex component 1-like n=1 Tax=Indicator indicator TaxID=1002788 RepID=UPI0023DF0CE1|nr:exocyst complex component 1-like [Indicator indicator]